MTACNEELSAQLFSLGGPVTWKSSAKGAATGWCTIDDPPLLVPMARHIASAGGRLSAVTGYLCASDKNTGSREVAYHFDLNGATLTVTVILPIEDASVPSLTPVFRGADWSERELMELYQVRVEGHPDPRRLFLDRSLAPAQLERLVPYSSFINAASGKTLWERILRQETEETP